MIKNIERPEWIDLPYVSPKGDDGHEFDWLDAWFNEHIEPINKALDEAVKVTGIKTSEGWGFTETEHRKGHTHKALLIGIEPIVSDLKRMAHDYSLRMTGRKTQKPSPALALAFEAGFNAAVEILQKENDELLADAKKLVEALRIARNRLEAVVVAIRGHGQNIDVNFFITEYQRMADEANEELSAWKVKHEKD